MIKAARAWMDSEGAFHQTREEACKAEFRRALMERFATNLYIAEGFATECIPVEVLVDAMFDLDKLFGEATQEDRRVEFADAKVEDAP